MLPQSELDNTLERALEKLRRMYYEARRGKICGIIKIELHFQHGTSTLTRESKEATER